MRSSTRRTILWTLALVVALALVAGAYLRNGSDTGGQAAEPGGPRVPHVRAGCGRESATDPRDLSIGRTVARCAPGSPGAVPLPARATVRVAIPERTDAVAPLLVAQALHEFAAENLAVQIVDMPEDEAYAAMRDGRIDAVVGGLDAVFLDQAVTAASGAKLVMGGPLARAPGDIGVPQGGLWATRSSIPDLDDWSTLADHALATTGGEGSAALYPIETIFSQRQVPNNAVDIIAASPKEAARRLAAGQISLAWLPQPVAADVGHNDSLMLVATLPASESIAGTVFGPRLLGPDRAVGVAFVRAVVRTINTHLSDGYDRPARAALTKAMHVSGAQLRAGSAPLFDWEIRSGTLVRMQRVFIEVGSVTYDQPAPERGLIDRSLYEDAVAGG